MAANVVWIIDTSSIAQVRRSVANARKSDVFDQMGKLVDIDRLVFPAQVVEELDRAADPSSPDQQYLWAKKHKTRAAQNSPTLDKVKEVLSAVPNVLDPDKDTGAEEADPYILAMALHLRETGVDARIVTEEVRDYPRKMSLNTAAGLLGIPSVNLMAFLGFEKIN
jgi:hypothetical protein